MIYCEVPEKNSNNIPVYCNQIYNKVSGL